MAHACVRIGQSAIARAQRSDVLLFYSAALLDGEVLHHRARVVVPFEQLRRGHRAVPTLRAVDADALQAFPHLDSPDDARDPARCAWTARDCNEVWVRVVSPARWLV